MTAYFVRCHKGHPCAMMMRKESLEKVPGCKSPLLTTLDLCNTVSLSVDIG